MYKISLSFLFALFLLFGCSKPEEKVSISFISNGGNDIPSQTLNSGSHLKETTPVNNGFIFTGWTYYNTPGTPFEYTNPIFLDATLNANWKPDVLNPKVVLYASIPNQISSLPRNMKFDNLGNLFFSSDKGIYKITASGIVSTFVKGNYWGITFDNAGNLFAIKYENTFLNIVKIDINGNVTPFLKVDFFASEIVFDKKTGYLFINNYDYGELMKIDPSGAISEFATGYGIIQDFSLDSFGNFYIASYQSITKLDNKGVNSWELGFFPNSFYIPHCPISDSKGNVYSCQDRTLSKTTPSTSVVTCTISNSFASSSYMTMDKDENIFMILSVSTGDYTYTNTIYKITF